MMVEVKITIDDDVFDALKYLADMKGVSVEQVLQERVAEDIARIKQRLNDPIVGLFNSDETDLSERDEEILRTEWND